MRPAPSRQRSRRDGASSRRGACWVLLVLVLAGSFLALLFQQPIPQDLSYHLFADRRALLGMPNFLDVVTNLPFLVVGAVGLRHCMRYPQTVAPRSWQCFFAGVALVGLGSASYHLAPSNATLVWDRLPMALAFMGLFVALLAEHTTIDAERLLLGPALLVGMVGVGWWALADDLRLYIWVQYAPLLAMPLIVGLLPGTYSHRTWLLGGLACYALAKASESMDGRIFQATAGAVSGHSLKHLCVGLGILVLYDMIRRRRQRFSRIACLPGTRQG